MNKGFFISIIIVSLCLSCEIKEEVDPFLISTNNIGRINDSTQIRELKEIFKDDSIVQRKKGDSYLGNANDIELYSKQGDKLLIFTPSQILDSTSTISTVQILDPSFKTDTEISTSSTFGEIKRNYNITKISNLISSIVVTVDELNASFTIDKKELPANLRYDVDMKIEQSQIPDNAKIKYFMLHWN